MWLIFHLGANFLKKLLINLCVFWLEALQGGYTDRLLKYRFHFSCPEGQTRGLSA